MSVRELMANSRGLWDCDALLEASAICVFAFNMTTCKRSAIVDLDACTYDSFMKAVGEINSSLDPTSIYNSGFIEVEWSPLAGLAGRLETLARLLSRETQATVMVRVFYIAYSNVPGHIGWKLEVGTCIPSTWEEDALYPRLLSLLRVIGGEAGFRLGDVDEMQAGVYIIPYSPFTKKARCVFTTIYSSEMEPGNKAGNPCKRERPGDYMLEVDRNLDELYPADPDSMNVMPIYTFISCYEPPWPCPETAIRILKALGLEPTREEENSVLLAGSRGTIRITCSPLPAGNRIELIEGDRDLLLDSAKMLVMHWAIGRLGLSRDHPYIRAIGKAESFSELIDLAFDYEDLS